MAQSDPDPEVRRVLTGVPLIDTPADYDLDEVLGPESDVDEVDKNDGSVVTSEGGTGDSSDSGDVGGNETVSASNESSPDANKNGQSNVERSTVQEGAGLADAPSDVKPATIDTQQSSSLSGPSSSSSPSGVGKPFVPRSPPGAVPNATSPTLAPAYDPVEDGLCEQGEIEKELDAAFADRRLLAEAEAGEEKDLMMRRNTVYVGLDPISADHDEEVDRSASDASRSSTDSGVATNKMEAHHAEAVVPAAQAAEKQEASAAAIPPAAEVDVKDADASEAPPVAIDESAAACDVEPASEAEAVVPAYSAEASDVATPADAPALASAESPEPPIAASEIVLESQDAPPQTSAPLEAVDLHTDVSLASTREATERPTAVANADVSASENVTEKIQTAPVEDMAAEKVETEQAES